MFSEQRVEAIAAGYAEQVRKGLKTFEDVFKEVEATYGPEMREAINRKLQEIRRIPTPVELMGERVDARFEEARKAKVEEWRRKGYSEKLIEKALTWADSWARAIAEIAKVDPAVIYPKALDSADTWLEELVKALV